MKKRIAYLLILSILFSLALIKADGTIAIWTRAYCLYNAGSGGYACDSGQVQDSNSASCNAANGVQCAEEGDVYCYAQANCEAGGTTTSSAANAYNVNWDSDSADCSCKVGSGKWNLGGEVAASSCCGDDSSEYKRTRSGGADVPSGYTTDSGDDACCTTSDRCIKDSACVTSTSTSGSIPTKAYCNAGTWEGGDAGSTQCNAIAGSGYWNLGGEVAATSCCGDDSGENKKTRACSSGCTSDSTDDACCDVSGDCVYSSACYTQNNYCAPWNSNAISSCSSSTWSEVEDCTTKASTDTDAGNDPPTAGTVTDYTGCSSAACTSSQYSDACASQTQLTEYYPNGASYSSTAKDCNDYDNSTCACTTGATLTESCDNWNCGSGKCQDSGSDWTRNTWAANGLCAQQACQGTTYRDYHTNAGSNAWGTSAEATETACADGYDNNCNGQWDYDTLNRGGMGASPHGDANCPVSVTAISLSTTQKCPGETVQVECTSSVADINSIDAILDKNMDGTYASDEKCTYVSWTGDKVKFDCNVGTSVGAKNVNCSVDVSKSYRTGTDKIAQITIGGTNCCSGYAASGGCDADSSCDWCPECSSTKYSGGGDRCVTAGSCSYYCWKGKCSAGCDDTQGGCIGAQTCETNCSCSSGSCDPDITSAAGKPCCDADAGYLPNQGVSQPISQFDNICPPTESCYNSTSQFEAGTGKCCGDDTSEYWVNRTCTSVCTTDAADEACCNTASDCVYNGICYSSSSKICFGNTVLNCNAGKWQQSQNCDASDGWYNYGDNSSSGCDLMNDATAERRDYSCSSGDCTYAVTQTKDCDSSDGWFGGGNTAGCGDDSSSQQRDYYTNSSGGCEYTLTNCPTTDCDASDICSNTCDGATLKSYKDYYTTINSSACTFVFGSVAEDCTTKNTYESDGGIDYLNSGYVSDYSTCSNAACQGTNYTDSCSADALTEYYASGTSHSSTAKDCNDYDNSTCACTTGATLTESCDNWNCGSGKCQDSGSDWTRNTWAANGLCAQQACQGTTYRDYHTNAGSNTWGASAEATETACADGYDNNCNGQWDYDTLDRGPAGNVPPHGESNCAISINSVNLSANQKCPGETVTVECISSVASVNSIDAVLDANRDGVYDKSTELCNFISWNGNSARFDCSVGTSLGAKNVNCSVNTAKSYKSGSDKITQITIGGTSCCSGYSSSSNCDTDLDCDWCLSCSGTKYSGGGDRCVTAGSCNYYCWKGNCSATCDSTQGGCIGAQTCETNCSCSSGSCNPDLGKPCCDADAGYLPNQGVSQPIPQFDNTCPPNETCFDNSWLFEAGLQSCCGDDANENWINRYCISTCTTDLLDEACCNSVTDCVYNDSCYNSNSCYQKQVFCNAGRWYDPDTSQTACDSCFNGSSWNISGDIGSCCGDDIGEFQRIETGAIDTINSDACCNSTDKCVDDDACYATSSCRDTGSSASASEYCDAGVWKDNDDAQIYCDSCVSPGKWAVGGEVAASSCCGDDSGEYYAGAENNRSCDGTRACCDSQFKFVKGGQCVLSCEGGFAEGKWMGIGVGPYGSGERKLVFEISDNFNNPQSIVTDENLPLNKLTHVVVTFNNNNGEAKIYIDGALKKSGTISRNVTSLNQFPYSISPLAFPMKGSIDEMTIYNRILGKDEIKQKYQLGTQITYASLPKKNEARTLKFTIDNATITEAKVAPIVKVGAMNKVCGFTFKTSLQKCG